MVAVPACRRAWAAIPEGYENVAGGRSKAETSGPGTDRIAHPGRVPETRLCQTGRTGHGSHPRSRVSGILSGCRRLADGAPGESLCSTPGYCLISLRDGTKL